MRRVSFLIALTLLGSCVISSRFIAGYGAMADSGSCGAGVTAAAVLINGAVATAILLGDELSTTEKVVIGGLAADTVIGGIEAIQDCTSD